MVSERVVQVGGGVVRERGVRRSVVRKKKRRPEGVWPRREEPRSEEAWSGREELLNADGEFCCIFHPLPHQVGPIRAVGKDALGACSLHGASIPAGTYLSQTRQGV